MTELENTDVKAKELEIKMKKVRSDYPTPEYINTDKGPSKHLENFIENYKKNKVGKGGFSWRAAKEIGLEEICKECNHFRQWIMKLENYENDISSSHVRELIKQKKDFRHYMPEEVYDYIEKNSLYI